MSVHPRSIGDAEFWRRPLAQRMADFAELREEHGAFVPVELPNLFGDPIPFQAAVGHPELVEISRLPQVFPRGFDDPDTFDVRRDPNPHVGFGGPGPHFCLGAHLARRELGIVFRQLLTRLPDIEPSGPPDFLEAYTIPLVSGVKHLPVTFTPTAPGT